MQPALYDAYISKLIELYREIEMNIITEIARRAGKGLGNDWQYVKLSEMREIREYLEKQVGQLNEYAPEEITRIVTRAYEGGVLGAAKDLKNQIGKAEEPITGSFGLANKRAIEQFTRELLTNVAMMNHHIIRSTLDTYRQIISEVTGSVLAGTETRLQATQRALNKFADRGVTGFVDKLGRRWSLEAYAEMSTRAAVMRSFVMGARDRIKDGGRNLVIISDHPMECPRCRPYEMKILALEADGEHETLDSAIGGGLFHPNCGHTMNAYIEGLTIVETPKHDAQGYELKQQQRSYERNIRQWKKRVLVAQTDEERRKAEAKVKHWQKQTRELVASDDRLRREYEREKIFVPK